MVESFVQLGADGSGKKVRNVQDEVPQPDGTTATVHQQVVMVADENGKIESLGALIASLLEEQRRTNELLMQILGSL